MLVFYLTHNSSDVSHQVWVFDVFTFVIWRFCAELWETLRGCSGDRWKGNVRIRIKQRRKQRAGREGGGDKKKKKTGSEIRFSLVAALHFPYQQARGNRQIWFSPKRANRKQAECVCGGGGRQEREGMGEKEEERKGMSKWKKDGETGEGWRSERVRLERVRWKSTRNAEYLHH